jgi:hypothetical protein
MPSIRGTSVGIVLPFDPDVVWGERERHDVTGQINDVSIRGQLQKDRDGYSLLLGPAWLRDSQLDIAAEVTVTLAPEGPQLATMPADIADAIRAVPEAKIFFESLPTFYRKNYLRWIEDAKRPETRTKRIHEAVVLLQNQRREK